MAEEEANEQLNKLVQKWWDSDAYKELQKANEESKQRAVGKYHMLSEEDKLDLVEAICYIMCKAEEEGTSHRGVMNALGIYPAGFWIDHLMDVHNALWTFYHDKKKIQELKDDLDSLDNFLADQSLKQKEESLTSLDSTVKLASPDTEVINDTEQRGME